MKSLKIALLTYSTKPRGGVVHTLNLAEQLSSLGHLVEVYALGTEVGFFRPVAAPSTLIPCDTVPGEPMDAKIMRYIQIYSDYLSAQALDFDIYHAEDCISANALLALRDRGIIKSFVRTVHHLDDFTSPALVECQLKSVLKPDSLIAVSRLWQRELRSAYSLDAALIHNGVDVDRFSGGASKAEARRRFNLSNEKIILSVGGIEPRKNSIMALRAFHAAASRVKAGGERAIWLIGGGETLFDYREYRDWFFSKAKGLHLNFGEDIIILGNVPDRDMPALYAAADVFIFPSIKEGWGLVALEAMAAGIPVIASKIEPLTDYLTDGENALLVSPTDSQALSAGILTILANGGLGQKLIGNARVTAEHYSWRKTALAHEAFYRGLGF
ncbi:MAG: MSMEG_0565 family glycosyltransferase [Deltaproteobacteria bacterium]